MTVMVQMIVAIELQRHVHRSPSNPAADEFIERRRAEQGFVGAVVQHDRQGQLTPANDQHRAQKAQRIGPGNGQGKGEAQQEQIATQHERALPVRGFRQAAQFLPAQAILEGFVVSGDGRRSGLGHTGLLAERGYYEGYRCISRSYPHMLTKAVQSPA